MFYGAEFISVSKEADEDWAILKPEILSVITEHYTRGQPLFTEGLQVPTDTLINEGDSEALANVKEILSTRVRPFVQEDGGDLAFVSFDEESGLVIVELKGACAGCPSSAITLKSGIENMLKYYEPSVKEVRALD